MGDINVINTNIKGLKVLEQEVFMDERGKFLKTFSKDIFAKNNLDIQIKETYFSISKKNVIRGMHFQTPPFDHIKIVYVPFGRIVDVILDLRKFSTTFKESFSVELSGENGKILIIPKGLAHGFISLENNTNVTYMQTTCYSSKNDMGIKYDSFGFDWKCKNPILSKRDTLFPTLEEFNTPFLYEECL
ncbi:dTDP-4-dehydrorhamnose 3,5-epimerase family protein [Campylobacter concisus]|jgi:dTDP-4-dehydrorhamnose 3,5-epimerase|uniref:dTDP-4-dehydrorhamnose 3,5-epimerase family protein n=1 Tax=Campylobacter concisus TaxID=199 RepID=UPI0015E16721|nr:dTDP-4-dehydrorhamnose 3,5-epimerase family protein [Campylobacter concisus]